MKLEITSKEVMILENSLRLYYSTLLNKQQQVRMTMIAKDLTNAHEKNTDYIKYQSILNRVHDLIDNIELVDLNDKLVLVSEKEYEFENEEYDKFYDSPTHSLL